MNEWADLLQTVGVVAAYWHLRRQIRSLTAVATPDKAGECVVKTFRYEDGHVAQKHSKCGEVPIATMTDAWAKTLHPQSKLVSTSSQRH